MAAKLKPRQARALLEQAELHRQRGEWEQATELARRVTEQSTLDEDAAFAILAEGYERAGKVAEAELALRKGLQRSPSPVLTARLGELLSKRGQVEEGLKLLERVKKRLGRDPGYLAAFGKALILAGREDDADVVLTSALTLGGGNDVRLVMAMLEGRRGRYEEADALAAVVEESEKGELLSAALAIRADCRLFLGDAAGSLQRWKQLEAKGQLNPKHLGHFAYAAQLAGEPALAEQLVARRLEQTPTAEDRLLFAKVCLLREEHQAALEHLDAVASAPGEHYPGHDYEVLASRGRALRLAGRSAEAKQVLDAAAALPEYATRRLGPEVRVDRGHLAGEDGDFLAAEGFFKEALELDPGDPEAKRALELTEKKIGWKSALEKSTEARILKANAEAEAMRRRFVSRESELEAMAKELQRLKAEHRAVTAAAEQAQAEAEAAAAKVAAEQRRRLQEELEARESDVSAKATENLERALGEERTKCPEEIVNSLRVAEKMFQQAINSDTPAAAVGVMFSGLLERSLFILYVQRFNDWLAVTGRRQAFLDGAVRERRGRRVDYQDHFVEAFDEAQAGRAPSMGEVARVLEKLDEPYLEPLRRFLLETYAAPSAFYEELATFVVWAKEEVRDPIAHGRATSLEYEALKRFREQLLFSFGKYQRGAIAVMLRRHA